MSIRKIVGIAASLALLVFFANPSFGQLYSENFDDGNAVSRWTANAGIGFDDPIAAEQPMDTNFDTFPFPDVDGVNDDFSGFAFDYSAHGIPPAPNNSNPNSTIGLKLQASLFSNRLGGFSASPNGLNLTGDYSITFDYWGSSIGSFPLGGSSSTEMSTFGLLTAGTTSQSILSADGVFFGAVADGGSGADYRVYSTERNYSYQLFDPANPDPIDEHATYFAGTRNGTGQLYIDATGVGDPGGDGAFMVPQSVVDAGANFGADLTGPLFSGAAGFQWHEMEIRKVGAVIDWYMNGIKLISLDTTAWSDPDNLIEPGGGNISFGHNDINFGSPTNQPASDFLYTLIDNIEVNAIVAVEDADFNGNGLVEGTDFLTWQRNLGTADALHADGDANGDMMVDAADLAIWQSQFGSPPSLSSVRPVPEPAALFSWITFMLFSLLGCRPCRQPAINGRG